jgi:hypothetical protein
MGVTIKSPPLPPTGHSGGIREMSYYSDEELSEAIAHATAVVNRRKSNSGELIRNYNCCFALAREYTEYLQGRPSEVASFEFKDTKEFINNIKRLNYNGFEDFAEANGYEIIHSKRPKHGDISVNIGYGSELAISIANYDRWVGILSCNGVGNPRQVKFLERRLVALFRPIKEN